MLALREPTSLAIDSAHQLLFVGDTAYQKVWVMHCTGFYVVREITSTVSAINQFMGITGLCFAPDNNELYVLDRCALLLLVRGIWL